MIATAAGAVALYGYAPTTGRFTFMASLGALVIVCAVGGRAQWRFGRFTRHPAEVGNAEAAAQRVRLKARVDEELRDLRGIARRARAAPTDQAGAKEYLEHDIKDVVHRASLVFQGDSLRAWVGTLHADPRQLGAPSGVVQTPFGLTLYVVDDSGPVRTVAASLLYAYSPADHLTRGLAQRLASGEVAEGFSIVPPADTARADELLYVDGSRPLFLARALVPSEE
ncbi:MAG: hypothetical protein ABI969_12710, partial [bacterium]